MSDISIPGVTSNYNSDKMVEELMRLERIPLTRMENQVEDYKVQREAWQDLNVQLSRLRDATKKLYGYQNPFNDRTAVSSEPDFLSATASRESIEGTSNIVIEQLAKADRFLSDNLDEDYRVESGTYSFQVGDDEISIRFRGGSLKSFADTINRRSNGLLRASVVRNTAETQILSLESSKTGLTNRLFFEEDSIELAKELGLIAQTRTDNLEFTPEVSDFREWKIPFDTGDLFASASGGVTFQPKTEGKLPLNIKEGQLSNKFLEFTIQTTNLTEEIVETKSPPPGPSIPSTGNIDFEGLNVFSATSVVEIPEWEAPPAPVRIDDLDAVYLQDGDRIISLDPIPSGDMSKTYRLSPEDKVVNLSSLNISNNNTHRQITVSNVRIYDPTALGDYIPTHPISTAQDSLITIDGIPITRDSNDIEDVIPGVTLTLRKETSDPISLDIGPDREVVKDEIINFVGTYNRIIAEINILTDTDPSVISQLDYFTADEKEDAAKKLGLYNGDSTLRQMKARLQQIMMNPYPTPIDETLSLLAQIGVSTNSAGGGFDTTRLKGYLEIDEDKLDASLETNFPGIKELFGHDSDGDLIVDKGIALELDNYIKSYVETGGILSYKVSSLDSRIDRANDDIDDYNEKLETRESELQREYGMMEGALESLKASTRALDNLNNSNN